MVISRGFQAWSCPPACYSPTCLYGKVQVQCSHACTCGFSKCISSFYNQQWRKLWVYITGSLIATACHTSGSSTGYILSISCTLSALWVYTFLSACAHPCLWKGEKPNQEPVIFQSRSIVVDHYTRMCLAALQVTSSELLFLLVRFCASRWAASCLKASAYNLWLVMQEAQDNHKQQETLAAVTQHSTHTYTKCGFWSLIEPNQLLATTSSVN